MHRDKPAWLQWKPKKQDLDSHWDIITIGSGLGALMAAAKLAKAGKRCLLIEQHYVAGGYAHHFPRKKKGTTYLFDVALHQTGNLKAGDEMYERFQEIDILDKIEIVKNDCVHRSVFPEQGIDITVPVEIEDYRALLKAQFPAEADNIDAFIDIMFAIAKELPELSAAQGDSSIDPVEVAPTAMKYMGSTLKQVFEETVQDSLLRALFSQLWPYLGLPPGELSALYFALMWTSMHSGTYYIRGGGQALSNAMCQTIEENAGAIKLRTLVEKIIVEDGRAIGVRTAKGDTFFADTIISNASTITTFNDMLDPGDVPQTLLDQVNSIPVSTSIIQAYVGIDGDAAELGLKEHELFLNRTLDGDAEWAAIKEGKFEGVTCLLANHSRTNQDACPEGKSIVEAAVLAVGDHWLGLSEEEYVQKKQQVTDYLLDQLAEYIPDIRDRIEAIEVGTPKTMYDYSLSPNGAIYGSASSATTHTVFRPQQRTPVPGLYLAGAWTFPGAGFGGALTSGYICANLILQDAKAAAETALI